MSFFSSLRDSVETGVAGYAGSLGLNITPELAVSAGGTPSPSYAAPSGSLPPGPANAQPGIPSLLHNHTVLIVGAVFLVVLVFLFKRR